jgi:hypothetical protein
LVVINVKHTCKGHPSLDILPFWKFSKHEQVEWKLRREKVGKKK